VWICANQAIRVVPESDKAVLKSFHAFTMPSRFLGANDADYLAQQPGDHIYPKIADLQDRFTQRAWKIALLLLLNGYYQEYLRDGLDMCTIAGAKVPQKSAYDLRSIYEEDAGKTDQQCFDECFRVLPADQDDPSRRYGRDEIYKELASKAEYKKQPKDVSLFMLGLAVRHPHMTQVNHHGTKKWTHLERKHLARGGAGQSSDNAGSQCIV
jgi:hypothetical protein